MRVRVDGFVHHNQHIQVVHPEQPDHFITARVTDPIFKTIWAALAKTVFGAGRQSLFPFARHFEYY